LARDVRFVGGKIGMMGILHTWGRNLAYHPHIHYLVPAGGLAGDGKAWLPARQDFLLPVKALSKIFRGKFRHALQKTALFTQIPPKVWQQGWVVHCKPVGNGRTALKYLAPYVFRVAISSRRLVSLENGQVTFRYRATDTGQFKLCTLSAEEFVHRLYSAAVSGSMCCQGLRENPLLWLLCTRLPQAPGCFATTACAEVPRELRGGRSCTRARRFDLRAKAVLPKLRSATVASTYHSANGTLSAMRKFSLSIISFNLGAGFEPSNSGFARPKPKKDLPVARFCPCTPTQFCYLDVQLFQKDQRWPRKSFDDEP
jgi:hypothetical protein